jgi:hypothetical protein
MSRISSCPKCARLVTLPQGADAEAQVRCPLCGAEYRLADAMAGMPPELMLVGASADAADMAMTEEVDFEAAPLNLPDPSDGDRELDDLELDTEVEFPAHEFHAEEIDASDAIASGTRAPLGGQDFYREAPALDEELELDDGEPTPIALHGQAAGSKDFDFGKPTAGGSPTIPPVGSKLKKSKSRKEPSAIGSLIGVVLGGIVGLSLGYLALLWIGGPDKDFAKVGGKLPGWMVPAAFQKQKVQAANASNSTSAPPAASTSDSNDDIKINVPDLDETNSADNQAADLPAGNDRPTTDAAEPSPFDDPTTKVTPESPADAATGTDGADPFTDPAASKPAVPETAGGDDPFGDPTAAPNADAPGTVTPAAADDPFGDPTATDTADAAKPATADAAIAHAPKEEMPEDKQSAATDDATDPLTADAATPETTVTVRKPAADDTTKPEIDPLDAAISDATKDDASAAPDSDVPAPSQPRFALSAPADYSAKDVSDALEKLEQATQKLADPAGIDKDALRKLRNQYYFSFYRLAEVATQSSGETVAKDNLAKLMSEAAADEKKIVEIGKAGATWMGLPQRGEHQGVLLAGTAEQIDKTPSGYTLKLRVHPAKQPVDVLTPNDPGAAEGDRVILIGSVVDRPKENILGYGGDDTPVVWLGHLEKLPAATQ